jgi:hypothetical protein
MVIAAVWVVVVVTGDITYAPLRRAMIIMATVLAAVSLLGWAPQLWGPVPDEPAALVVRTVGFVLAGLVVWGVVVEFWFNGDPSQVNPGVAERASTGIPSMTVVCAIHLAAFLAVTRRGSMVRGATLLHSTAFAVAAVILWAGMAILLPPASSFMCVLMMGAACIGAAVYAGRRAVAPAGSLVAGLLSAMMTGQIAVSVADVMFHLGPDSWIPDAGPGPLTLQARLEQSRIEAIDPYVAVLLIGTLVAVTLIVVTLAQRARRPVDVVEATASANAARA